MTDDTLVGIIEGEKLLIKIGDAASPEMFAHPCLINTTRDVSFTSNITTTEVADCADPSLPAKIVQKVKSVDFTITGAGKIDKKSVLTYIQWWQSGLPKNAIVDQNTTGADGGWNGVGKLILKDFKIAGTRGDYQDCNLTFVPAGTFDWEAND